MSYLERWHSQLPATIEHAANAVPPNASIGPGLLAAVALWPVRADVQAFEDDALDAVRGSGTDAARVVRLSAGWNDDLLTVGGRGCADGRMTG